MKTLRRPQSLSGQIMCCRSRSLAGACLPACPIFGPSPAYRLGLGKDRGIAAGHEGQGSGRRADGVRRTPGIDHLKAFSAAAAATRRAVSTSIVEQSISSAPGAACARRRRDRNTLPHLRAGRQHRDDDSPAAAGLRDASGGVPAVFAESSSRSPAMS